METETLDKLKSQLKEEFSDYYEMAGGRNYRYLHLITVHKMVKKLAEKVEEDLDIKVLEISALFHDIGRAEDILDGEMDPFEGHEGHAERGAEKVQEFIQGQVSDEELKEIKKIIRNHHSNAESIEGKILQDADKISNFGVNNLWRQFHYASENRVELDESIEYFWNEGLEDYRAQIENMYFDKSKEIAEKRLERQKDVFMNIEEEMNAEDF